MGRLTNSSTRRSSTRNASRNAAVFSRSLPVTAAGSATPQCAVIGWPGQTGQTSPAALSQTVMTKSSGAAPGAAPLEFVITVCDNAAGEVCPVWPGQPMTAHWGVADPAAVTGSDLDKTAAFREAFRVLDRRVELFVSLPMVSLDRMALARRLVEIGRS